MTAAVASTTSGTPGGTVTFFDNGTAIGSASLNNGTAVLTTTTLLPGAVNIITASYGGCNNFSSANSGNTSTIPVAPLDFSIALAGSSTATVVPGSTVAYQVIMTPLYGSYAGTVSFTVNGLPAGYSVSFSPASISSNGGPQTVTVTITTPPATAAGQSVVLVGRRMAPLALALILLPLAGAKRMRRQGRRMMRWLTLLLLVGGVAATVSLSGCGATNGFFQQALQNYNITITASGGGLTHSVPVILQVQ